MSFASKAEKTASIRSERPPSKMSLLLPPPTPGSNSRDYSKDDDSDSDVSEDSAG